jgi:hypothetical protein
MEVQAEGSVPPAGSNETSFCLIRGGRYGIQYPRIGDFFVEGMVDRESKASCNRVSAARAFCIQ